MSGSPRTFSTSRTAKGLLKANLDAFAHSVRDRDVDQGFLSHDETASRTSRSTRTCRRPAGCGIPTWLQSVLQADEYAAVQKA